MCINYAKWLHHIQIATIMHLHAWSSKWPSLHSINTGLKRNQIPPSNFRGSGTSWIKLLSYESFMIKVATKVVIVIKACCIQHLLVAESRFTWLWFMSPKVCTTGVKFQKFTQRLNFESVHRGQISIFIKSFKTVCKIYFLHYKD